MPADLHNLLDRIVAKYRRDVHDLAPAASPEALAALEGHLGRELPPGLRAFLGRHNGGSLFRGQLRIRSTSEMALASAEAPQVALFADEQDGTRWAWAADAQAGHVFGPWDGERLTALHGGFEGWFRATLGLLDTRVQRPEDQEALRFEADPDDVYQLVQAGERALVAGRPEEAESLLRKATAADPSHVVAWQRLGDALAVTDRSAARMAWLQAFRNTRLPLPWPGAPALDEEVLRPLSGAFPASEDWERELERFLSDQVRDLRSEAEAGVVVAAARELARSLVRRGRREQARDVLADLLARFRVFTWQGTPWEALLELAALETDLGHHDEAEALLRRLRREGPRELQGRGALLLARIAVTRQEPWAEDILDDALATGLDDADTVRAAVLRIERAIRSEKDDRVDEWLERARSGARRVALRPLQALVALAAGDVHRVRGELREATVAYRRGLELLDGGGDRRPGYPVGGDAEVRHRILLRLGDLAMAAGRPEEAAGPYREAAEGFARSGLPVREGWALLRLARLADRPGPLLEAARDRFAQADLAAGIAALDAATGDPGASLAWHLDRATAHARARHDAQRSRPPWERSDAERPERRLGAHRLAIAACDEGVVRVIAAEMEDCARSMSTGRSRALDPPVLRYVAAVDLLSGHRSYSAAQVLLRHLLSTTIEGPARRALEGSIARSPNAAMVDGLLSCIERAHEHPAPSVAAAAELLGLRCERAAVRPLVELAGPRSNPIARKSAIVALGRVGDRGVVDRIAPALEEPTLAEAAGISLLMLGDRRGVDFHGQALAENRRDLSRSPGEIVGRYGGPSYLLLLVNTARGEDDRALGALQGLGLMGDPRAVPTLLEALASRDSRKVEVANGALTILTGHAEDLEEHGARARWNQWWETQSQAFPPGVRHRDGRPFDGGILLERMEHPDAWTRRTAYDELVITTGQSRPYDADGPWRMQRAHLKAWRDWWSEARHTYGAGKWYLDGKPLG